MEAILLQYGWVMWLAYLIINFVKPYMSDKVKKYIPIIAIVLAGALNMVADQTKEPLQALLEGFMMWLANGKINDITKKTTQVTENAAASDPRLDV